MQLTKTNGQSWYVARSTVQQHGHSYFSKVECMSLTAATTICVFLTPDLYSGSFAQKIIYMPPLLEHLSYRDKQYNTREFISK